jgi:hypothetical protein
LSEASYSCTITVTDSAGNASSTLSVNTFVVDTTAPSLSQSTAVTTPTKDPTPSYAFSSDEAGTISYGGCSPGGTSAINGTNTISFGTLSEASYSCTITVTDPAGNASSALSVNTFLVDTTRPTVSSVSSISANGSYKLNDNITVTVNFSESVIVDNSSGNPRIQLETGTNDNYANYISGSLSNTLSFLYKVQSGDNTSDLDYTSTSSLSANNSIIRDNASNYATLTLPSPGASSSLGTNKAIVVDGIPPSVVSTNPADNSTNIALTPSISVTFSESMDNLTVTKNSDNTSCLGSFQLSSDNFSTCIKMIPNVSTSHILNSSNNHYYKFYNSSVSWSEALSLSEAEGGYLVTVTSNSELTFLWNNFNAYFNQQENVPWISLTDQETEGTWKYASGPENGQTASWALWANGEGGSSPGEDYAVLHWQRGNGNFFDYTSEYNQPYIVEWDTAPLEISSYVTASDSNKTYTVSPSDNLLPSTNYKIRITNDVKDSTSNTLENQYNSVDGFTTLSWLGTQVFNSSDNKGDTGADIEIDSSGNIYLVGTTNGLIGSAKVALYDGFIIKTNSAGVKLWAKNIGETNFVMGSGVKPRSDIDNSGNLYVVYTPNVQENSSYSGRGQDIWYAKYNSSGTELWSRTEGTGSQTYALSLEYAYDIKANNSGYAYLAIREQNGFCYSQKINGVLYKVEVGNGNKVTCRNIQPDYILGITYPSSEIYAIALDASANIYVTGNFMGSLIKGAESSGGWSSVGEMDIFVRKYSDNLANYDGEWSRTLGTSGTDRGNDIAIDSSGNIYVTGQTSGSLNGNAYSGDSDLFLMKYNSSGTLSWVQQLGTSGTDVAEALAIDNNGDIYITGYTNGALGDIPVGYSSSHIGGVDIFLVKYNSSGVKQWTKQLGTSSDDRGNGVTVDNSSNIYVTGSYGSGSGDIFLMKFNSDGDLQ